MEFFSFKRQLLDAIVRLQQTQITATVANAALADFPSNLPEQMRTQLEKTLGDLGQEFKRVLDQRKVDSGLSVRETAKLTHEGDPIGLPTVTMLIANMTGKGSAKVDFSTTLFSQSLVTTIALADGFLNDCVKAACRRQPNLLRRNKQLSWDAVVEARSWEVLLEKMIEEFSFEFGWKGFRQRIESLCNDFGLEIDTDGETVNALEMAYQVRHVMVHNGGRASAEFLKRTCRTDISLGDPILVTEEYAHQVAVASEIICVDVFLAIAVKFFPLSEIDITGITIRSPKLLQALEKYFSHGQ